MKSILSLLAFFAVPAAAQTLTYSTTPGYLCADGSVQSTLAKSKIKLKEIGQDGGVCSKTITIKISAPTSSPTPTPTAAPTPTPPPAPAPVNTGGIQGPTLVSPVTQAIQGSARTFNVASDAELAAVPWATLTAGDVVNIAHKSTPYKVKFGIRGQGTAAAPITINGVTNANGNRPVLDFNGARTAPAPGVFSSTLEYGEALGGIVILRGQGDDWNTYKPRHVKIANLDLRNAKQGNSYIAQNGALAKYGTAAGVYVLRGADVTLENLVITNNSFGVFTMAKGEALLEAAERVTLRNSWFKDNGVPGSYFEHGVYLQADSPVVEGNYFGKVISGSYGSSFKDRSAKLIFRNNYVLSSSRAIDLVHSEEQANGIAARPYYGTDYVYGNTIINDSAYEAIHFGGDNQGEQEGNSAVFVPALKYRSLLYFWNNTVKHTSSEYRNIAFGLSLKDTTAHAWGNTFEFGPQAANHYWLEYAGQLNLYSSNRVTGPVQAAGRDGAAAGLWAINRRAEAQPAGFVAP